MKAIYFSCIIAVLLILGLVGCAPVATPTNTPVPTVVPAAPPAPVPAVAFPLSFKDDLGRKVTLKAAPQRIVSLLPSNTEILFAVGAGQQVVGVTSYCNYPPEAAKKEQVGGITTKSLSLEKIVALQPNLVLAASAQADIIPTLEKAGLTVMALKPATFDDIYANIEQVGQATGHSDQAKTLTAGLRQRVEAVKAKINAIPADKRPTVFYEVWHDPLMTAGPHTFIGQMMTLAGGKNIFNDVTEDWPQVSAEVIVQRNPTVIVGPTDHSDQLTAAAIAGRSGWANLDAVKNNRIYILNGDAISRPGPRIVDMLEELARKFYPNLFQ
jgi:iron complex transport system substrate-binding protein